MKRIMEKTRRKHTFILDFVLVLLPLQSFSLILMHMRSKGGVEISLLLEHLEVCSFYLVGCNDGIRGISVGERERRWGITGLVSLKWEYGRGIFVFSRGEETEMVWMCRTCTLDSGSLEHANGADVPVIGGR